MATTVEVDSRGRLSLGKVAKPGTYRASTRTDGSIVLEPAVVLTRMELAVMNHPQVSADLDAVFDGTIETVDVEWESR